MEEILSASAVALGRAIRARRVSSTEVVEAYLQRIEQVDPAINAVVQRRAERARAEAYGILLPSRTGRWCAVARRRHVPAKALCRRADGRLVQRLPLPVLRVDRIAPSFRSFVDLAVLNRRVRRLIGQSRVHTPQLLSDTAAKQT